MSDQLASIMIVDDEAGIRENLAAILEDEGFLVSTATDGGHALRLLRDGPPPQLIVLDLMMPLMNGWEFRDRQLSDPALARIPVIVVSGVASVRTEAALLKAADFAAKPISPKRLLEIIARHLPSRSGA